MKKTDNWEKAMEVRKKRKINSLKPKNGRSVSPITLKRIVWYVLKRAKDPDVTSMQITIVGVVGLCSEHLLVTVTAGDYDNKEYLIWRRACERPSVTLAIETALKNNGVPVRPIAEGRQGLVIYGFLG